MQLTQVQRKPCRYLIYLVVSHSLTTKTSPNQPMKFGHEQSGLIYGQI